MLHRTAPVSVALLSNSLLAFGCREGAGHVGGSCTAWRVGRGDDVGGRPVCQSGRRPQRTDRRRSRGFSARLSSWADRTACFLGTGSRSAAIGVATAIFAAGYLLTALGGLVRWLESARVISPYHHAVGGNPLVEGWPLAGFGLLVLECLVALAVAIFLFDRRDLV